MDFFNVEPARGSFYAIAAVHKASGKRHIIPVREAVTREQLQEEVRRMNHPQGRKPQFVYVITNQGYSI